MSVLAPWTSAGLSQIRYTQSLDVVFIAFSGGQQVKIERRGNSSWSVVTYLSDDGPFTLTRTSLVTLAPAATRGNTTLAASSQFFEQGHLGALFHLTHDQLAATYGLGGARAKTPGFRVTGIHASGDRAWSAVITGTWAGTITVQRSFDDQNSGYADYGLAITSNGTVSIDDTDDNAIVWYRLIFKIYTSGSAQIAITYPGYGFSGVCRVTHVASPTSANIEVLSDFANTSATDLWLEGEWSTQRGFPTAISLFDGRLWQARKDQFWGSVSGSFYSYTLDVVGDAGSVQRVVATGSGFSDINWLLPLQRLIFGTSGAEVSARASSFDEPLTPTNITLKDGSSQGSAPASPVKIDTHGIFIQRSTHKLYELAYDWQNNDYVANNLMRINEDIGTCDDPSISTGFIELGVQRQPETYVWAVRDDGVLVVLLYEPGEKVVAWFRVITGQVTGDQIISVAVLPQQGEDAVYFLVKRQLPIGDGRFSANFYIEKLRSHKEAYTRIYDSFSQTLSVFNGVYQCDCHVVATVGADGATVAGLDHLEGHDVIVLGNSPTTGYGPIAVQDFPPTVSGGQVVLAEALFPGDSVTVGLAYTGQYKSSKLAYGAQGGTALLQTKRVTEAGLLLQDTNRRGITIGSDLNGSETMFPLPGMEDGVPVDLNAAFDRQLDKKPFPFPGSWDTDARLCIQIDPGYSATLNAIVIGVETNER